VGRVAEVKEMLAGSFRDRLPGRWVSFAGEALSQEHLEERLVRNVALVGQHLEIFDRL